MRILRRLAPCVAVIVIAVFVAARPAGANEGGVSLFVRGDSDQTIVVSPRASARAVLDDERTRIDAAYAADIWTSASIDIRTAATPAVTEQRDQVDLAVQHELDDVTLGGSYYYSGEHDYWSHGFTLRSVQELLGGSTTLEESFRFVHDLVGRAGDPAFERPLDSFNLRLVLNQVLSPQAIIQVAWEGAYRTGFQSSPYRFVALGGDAGDNGLCGGSAGLCVPEAHPGTRIRNAFVAKGRFAFSRDSSAGVEYRFYFDDWGVTSHTAIAQIAWIPERNQVLTLRYRFYAQTAASFYQARYEDANLGYRLVTRDRELSSMLSNRLAASYQGRAELSRDVTLKVSVAVGGTIFVYDDYIGLDEVYGLDGTLAFALEL